MDLEEICNRDVAIVQAGESLRTAARLMHGQRVGSVVVYEERGAQRLPIGMLTDRDILMTLLESGSHLDETLVGEVMSRDPLVLHESESIEQAIAQMRSHAVRRTPVVSKSGSLVGIVSVDDLLELLAEQLNDIARLIKRQIKGQQQ
jgi:CBS domain-containing protein